MKRLFWIIIGIVAYFVICRIAETVLLSMLDITDENTIEHIMSYEFLTFSFVTVLIFLIGLVIATRDIKNVLDEEIIYGCLGYPVLMALVFSALYAVFPTLIVIIVYNVINISVIGYWMYVFTD